MLFVQGSNDNNPPMLKIHIYIFSYLLYNVCALCFQFSTVIRHRSRQTRRIHLQTAFVYIYIPGAAKIILAHAWGLRVGPNCESGVSLMGQNKRAINIGFHQIFTTGAFGGIYQMEIECVCVLGRKFGKTLCLLKEKINICLSSSIII